MPRPSSPVHAKAFTRCPYLTLESPHHQRQYWVAFVESFRVVIKLSQIILCVQHLIDFPDASLRKHQKTNPMSPRHRLKNPFTMSKRLALRAISPALAGKPLSSSTRVSVADHLIGAPTNRRFARPNGRRCLCSGHPIKEPFAKQMVEPIGIEPMT